MEIMNDEDMKRILEDYNNIAVVGCSSHEDKYAHVVPKFLQERGYTIIPVNPNADEVLGEKSYPSLSEVEKEVDIVDIFRPSSEVPGIVEEALDVGAKVIWMQFGIENEEAKEKAEKSGLEVVQNRCMKVQYMRLLGQ